MRPQVRSEQGFTLLELLVAMVIGMVVLLAAFKLADAAMFSRVDTENRLDAAQRGRRTMDVVSRDVRSQMCPSTGVAPIEIAEADRSRFFASLVSAQSGSVALQKREVAYEVPGGSTRGQMVERVYLNKGTATQPVWDTTTPDQTNVISGDITKTTDSATGTVLPVFTYYKYDPTVAAGDPSKLVELTPPISASDLGLVVEVRIRFTAWPTGNGANVAKVQTAFDNRVFVRTADPTDPTHSPRCL